MKLMRRPGVNPSKTAWVLLRAETHRFQHRREGGAKLGELRRILRQQGGKLGERGNEYLRRRPPAAEDCCDGGSCGDAPGNSSPLHPAPQGMDAEGKNKRKEHWGDNSPHGGQAESHDSRTCQSEQDDR